MFPLFMIAISRNRFTKTGKILCRQYCSSRNKICFSTFIFFFYSQQMWTCPATKSCGGHFLSRKDDFSAAFLGRDRYLPPSHCWKKPAEPIKRFCGLFITDQNAMPCRRSSPSTRTALHPTSIQSARAWGKVLPGYSARHSCSACRGSKA